MISWSTNNLAGIHLGDTHVTALRATLKAKGLPFVTHAGWRPYDSKASEKEIAAVVRTLWHDIKMPTRMVCSSLRSPSMIMRYFKVPSMSESELRSALTLQAEEAMHLTREKLSVDWHVEGRAAVKTGGAMVEGILAAAPTQDVDRQLEVLRLAGLDPVIVDIRSMAVANLFLRLDNKAGEASVCLVNLSPHSADVVVMRKLGGVYPYTVFCRASTWGEAPGFLGENIRDVLKYSEFKLDWDGVKRVLLTGEVPANGGFLETLRKDLGMPVEIWNPWDEGVGRTDRVKALLDGASEGAPMLVPALGLALRRQ